VAALSNVTATIGAVTGVAGIFDADYQDAFGVAGSGPVLLIQTAAAPAVATGNTVAVSSTNYTVVGIQPDGTGMTRLILEAV
jgi:hypothetical protein